MKNIVWILYIGVGIGLLVATTELIRAASLDGNAPDDLPPALVETAAIVRG